MSNHIVVECKKCGGLTVTKPKAKIRCRKCGYIFFLCPTFDAPPANVLFSGDAASCFKYMRGEENGIQDE